MQKIFLRPYDSRWEEEFVSESAAVASSLGEWLVAIHHVGSTAIPGILAKPIIDILAVVSSISLLDEKNSSLQALGYEVMGEFGIPGRRYFRKDDSQGLRTHQIHAFEVGSDQIERHLAFRDFLRAHPDEAHRYETLKARLARAFPEDIASYSEGKDAFIKEVDKRAASWRMITESARSPVI